MFNGDTIFVGYVAPDNVEEFIYSVDFGVYAESFENYCIDNFDTLAVLEDFQILDDAPLDTNSVPELKMSFYIPITESGAVAWCDLEKKVLFDNLGHVEIVIYYALPDGGDGRYNFLCEMSDACKQAHGFCERITTADMQTCFCMQTESPNLIGCNMIPLNNNPNTTELTWWQKLIKVAKDVLKAIA